MLKFHLFPRDSGKRCRPRAYPKLPLGLELRSTALGQFWICPRPASFPESLGKRWNFGPKTQISKKDLSYSRISLEGYLSIVEPIKTDIKTNKAYILTSFYMLDERFIQKKLNFEKMVVSVPRAMESKRLLACSPDMSRRQTRNGFSRTISWG